MSIVKCSGSFAMVNAEKLFEEFLTNEKEQLFLLTGLTGIGKTTTIRKKMNLINQEVHFHRYTVIEDKEVIRKALIVYPSAIHVWESVYSEILDDSTIQELLKDIALKRIKFTGKFIIVGDNLTNSVKTDFQIIMGANIDMENKNILDTIRNNITIESLINKSITKKPIVYVDMDNVLVDFPSAFKNVSPELLEKYDNDEIPDIFSKMEPMEGAIEAYKFLTKNYDTYILSTAPWKNPSAWSDKLLWVQKYLGDVAYKRLILTHHKDLNKGDYLIDDRPNNGAEYFDGKLIQFGSEEFSDWKSVIDYMKLELKK